MKYGEKTCRRVEYRSKDMETYRDAETGTHIREYK